MRLASACAIMIAGIAAWASPASATANWDYTCSAEDKRVRIDVSLVVNQGTAGRISVTELNAAAHHSAADVVTFAPDDIEQYWVADDAFRISFSRYQGGEPEPVQLKIETTCKGPDCKGTFSYFRQGTTTTGAITCAAGEKG